MYKESTMKATKIYHLGQVNSKEIMVTSKSRFTLRIICIDLTSLYNKESTTKKATKIYHLGQVNSRHTAKIDLFSYNQIVLTRVTFDRITEARVRRICK